MMRVVQLFNPWIGRISQSSLVLAYILFMVMMIRFDFSYLYRFHFGRKHRRDQLNASEILIKYQSPFLWEAMPGLSNTSSSTSPKSTIQFKSQLSDRMKHKDIASEWLGGQPLYISLTTIHSRIYGLYSTIESIIEGHVLPNHIYIFVSRDSYLLDHGVSIDFIISEFKNLNKLLLEFPYISIIFTENIGPHRKLLPLLSQKWNEDCVIVTIDDHEIYPKSTVLSLLQYYNATDRAAVVALRTRRMGLCSDSPPWRLSAYTQKGKGLWPESSHARREMLTLPTGTGGVLYRPIFFHPVVFDRRFLNLTQTGDDLMFRLATMAKGVSVVTACVEERNKCPSIAALKELKQFEIPVGLNFSNDEHLQPDFMQNAEQYRRDTELRLQKIAARKDDSWLTGIPNSLAALNGLEGSWNNRNESEIARSNEINWAILNSGNGVFRHKLTRRRRLRGSRNSDPRKIDSLASRFNTKGGNNMMWDQSVQFLLEQGILDFDTVLQKFAPVERNNCLYSPSVLLSRDKKEANTHSDPLSRAIYSTFESLTISFQNFYDKECGIHVCEV